MSCFIDLELFSLAIVLLLKYQSLEEIFCPNCLMSWEKSTAHLKCGESTIQ